MAQTRDWSNLGRQVRERREELGLTQEDVAQKGGPSTATQREIERGKAMRKRPAIYRNLEKVLQLREGSAMRALLGGQLEPLEDESRPEQVSLQGLTDEDKQAIHRWVAALRRRNIDKTA